MTDVQEVLDNFYHEYGDGITQIGIYDNEDIPIEFRQRFDELMQKLYKLYSDMSDWYHGESTVTNYLCGNASKISCPLCGICHEVNLRCAHLRYCPTYDEWYPITVEV